MRFVLVVAALASACTSGQGPAAADLAPSIQDTYTCAQSLAEYCSQHDDCVADLATAETTAWCSDSGRWSSAEVYPCSDIVIVWALGADGGGTGYVYDAATTALEAVIFFDNNAPPNRSCLAGPPTLRLTDAACSSITRICPR